MYEHHDPVLFTSSLFENVEPEQIRTVLRCFHPRRETYKKNNPVFCTGDVYDCMGLVVEGCLTMYKENAQGDRFAIGDYYPGDFFGELFAFSNQHEWPYTLIAQSTSTVVFFSPERISGVCEKNCAHHKELVRNMLAILSKQYLELERRLTYLSLKKTRHKLIHYLLDQWKEHAFDEEDHPVIHCSLNRNELAAYLGLARPSLSRELCALRDDQLISFSKGKIMLLNLPRLRQEAGL